MRMDSIEESIVRAEPPGVRFLRRSKGFNLSIRAYRTSVLIITFIAYACFHASRKPISIVKGVLKAEWAPFSGETATARLGEIDLAFLLVYSLGMYFAGHLGDRVNLRIFLTIGMIGSGTFVALFGMGYWWNIHSFIFYLSVQMVQGLFQATGWPSVVAVVSNWFGKRKRGLIMGVWNSHTSVGNICGSLIAAAVLQYGWGWCFLLPGILVAMAGIMVFLFLVVSPEDAGFTSINDIDKGRMRVEDQSLIGGQKNGLSNQVSSPSEFHSSPENLTFSIELSKVDSCASDVNGVIDPYKAEPHGGDQNAKLNREELLADGEEVSLLQLTRIASIESSATTAHLSSYRNTMSTQGFDPNNAQNLVEIEKQFAVKAVEHAQTYWNLLEKVSPRALKLTKLDDEIYEHTMSAFPEFNEENHVHLVKLDEDWLKSDIGKKKWREFCQVYEKKVKDYNFGSLIRTDARKEYGETNTIFVTRIQFYAIEIARNRLGLNDAAHEIAKADFEKERLKKEKAAKRNGTS